MSTPYPILLLIVALCFQACSGQRNQSATANKEQSIDQLDGEIWKVFHDSSGKHWFGSNGQGVFIYDGKELKSINSEDGLVDNSIRGFQEDKHGNVYIETPKGISKYDGKIFSTLKLINDTINEWKYEEDDLWFSCNTNAKDVYRYDGENLYELKLPRQDLETAFGFVEAGMKFNPYSVYAIDKDLEGNIWFGTESAGAFRYNGQSFLWIGEPELSILEDGRVPAVRSIIQDKDGYFWLSNFISKYEIKSDTTFLKLPGIDFEAEPLNDMLPFPYFNSGIRDKEGNLWMTTYSENVWKYDGKTLSNFKAKYKDKETLLVSIYEDKQGTIWLGTNNIGVFKFNGEKFEKYIL